MSIVIVSALSTFGVHAPASPAATRALEPLQAGERRPPGPPPEAVDACKDKSEGNACVVNLHGTTIDGTCRNGPDGNGPLACMPAHPPAPPPEAVEACLDKADGDACSVAFGDRTVDGICRTPPEQDDLACMPNGPPR
jgi:hypothetical protein